MRPLSHGFDGTSGEELLSETRVMLETRAVPHMTLQEWEQQQLVKWKLMQERKSKEDEPPMHVRRLQNAIETCPESP
jgi:hypothetical protein